MSDPCNVTILQIPKGLRNTLILAKQFACMTPGEKPTKTEYKSGKDFATTQRRVENIYEWSKLHQQMMGAPHVCYIRGEPIPGFNPQSMRRLLTNYPDTPRHHLYVDYDSPDLPRGEQGAEHARRLLPEMFHNAPCFWARTASYGVDYVGRKPTDDPWRSRIRLGFWLDRPLDAPRIKRWLRNHGCDLAIYTPNQITYTANPLFTEGAIDPVLAANEERFGTLGFDDAIVDVVPIPDEIFNWIPTHSGVSVATRPASIAEHTEKNLRREAEECDAEEGKRHGSVAQWVFDAFGLGMDEDEIVRVATETLTRLGRDDKKAKPEAIRLVNGARTAMDAGRLTVSEHHCPGKSFGVIDPNDPNLTPKLQTPAQVAAQTQALINWWDKLKISPSTGTLKCTLDNAAIILANHSSFKDKTDACILAYDAFQDRAVWTEAPPWWRSRPTQPAIGRLGFPIEDNDFVALSVWLGHLDPNSGPEGTPIHIGPETCANAIGHVSRYRTVNPAQEYLTQCAQAWDKTPRLNSVLKDVCHSPTDPRLLALWFPKWMMQSVARIYHPGTKCDSILVLQGGQGAKKSTFFRTLCPFPEWFMDAMPDLRDKDAMQLLRGKMIVEMSEMFSAKKDVDFLKGFVTKQDDTFRKSYGREESRRPRTVIFCGTTNDDDCLTDIAGRRWWMVTTPTDRDVAAGMRIDLARVEAERDQWWGEAVHRYRAHEDYWLDVQDAKETAAIALQHSAGMEQAADIHAWLNTRADKGGPACPDMASALEIWTGPMGRSKSHWHSGAGRMVATLMKGVPTWEHMKFSIRSGKNTQTMRAYFRSGSKMALDISYRNDYIAHHTTPEFASADFATV